MRYTRENDLLLSPLPNALAEAGQGLFREAMLARLARHLGPCRVPRALDLGCGSGEWTAEYLKFAERVTGVDVNAEFVAAAQRRAEAKALAERVSFLLGELESFEIDGEVGFVSLGACLMYVSDVQTNRLLARIARAVPRPGVLYVRASVALWKRHASSVGTYRSVEEYETLFRANGFEVVDCALSAVVVAEHLVESIPLAGLRRLSTGVIAGLARASRVVRHRTDYCNWVLRSC